MKLKIQKQPNCLIGTYYKDLKDAQKSAEEKTKLRGKPFEVLRVATGWFVVSSRQLEELTPVDNLT